MENYINTAAGSINVAGFMSQGPCKKHPRQFATCQLAGLPFLPYVHCFLPLGAIVASIFPLPSVLVLCSLYM
jgi:hypothetical protein